MKASASGRYSWLEDYLARLEGKEARREYYERYYALQEAAQKLAEAIVVSYWVIWERSAEAQGRQVQLTRSFFEGVIVNLRDQLESNLDTSLELAEQARRGQGAGRALARESVSAYMDFLDSMFSYYRGTWRRSKEEP
jgi:hypothetical protein